MRDSTRAGRLRRQVPLLVAMTVLGSTFLSIAPPSALAISCSYTTEKQIFVIDGLIGLTATQGTAIAGTLSTRDRGLDSACNGEDFQTWSMVHADNLSSPTRQFEAGWQEGADASGAHVFKRFWEWQVGQQAVPYRFGSFSCCGDYRFKLSNVAGTTKWIVEYHAGDTGTYLQVGGPGTDVGFSNAYPEGETSVVNENTGAADYHYNQSLYRKTKGWTTWPAIALYSDNITGWASSYNVAKPASYQVVQG